MNTYMKQFIIILSIFLTVNPILNGFTINFVVGATAGDFQTLDLTATNGINVSIITFNSFTPTIGATTFEEIINNSTVLTSGVTTSLSIFDGIVAINSDNITGFDGVDLYAFANFQNQEFGLWRDITGTGFQPWTGRDDNTLTQRQFDPINDTLTSFAGSIIDNETGRHFILEAVPEPSTYALMVLGGLALIVGYGRKRRI